MGAYLDEIPSHPSSVYPQLSAWRLLPIRVGIEKKVELELMGERELIGEKKFPCRFVSLGRDQLFVVMQQLVRGDEAIYTQPGLTRSRSQIG